MWDTRVKIIFLGTGTSQGVPVIGSDHPVCLSTDPRDHRLRASVYIATPQVSLLIDCGPDFRQQMLREKITTLDAVLFTHEHNDHVIGLDDMRPLIFNTQKPMPLYGLQRVLNEIPKRFAYAFGEKKYPGAPSFALKPIDSTFPFQINGEFITPIPVMHGKLPILGYRIQNVAYLTDVSEIPDESIDLLQGLDVLVIDALRQSPEHHSHLTLSQALAYIQKIQPKKAYLTHISHLMGLYNEVEPTLPQNVHLAFDGLKIEL